MDINNEQLEVSSSLFYAIPNPPEKQKAILNYNNPASDIEDSEVEKLEPSTISTKKSKAVKQKRINRIRNHKNVFKAAPSQLGEFYPGFEIISTIQSKPRKKTKSSSKTRKTTTKSMKTGTLDINKNKSRKEIKKKSKKKAAVKVKKKKKVSKNSRNVSPLTDFVKLVPLTIKTNKKIQEVQNGSDSIRKTIYTENEPFPFTNLVEWLLWHENYPELAYVREAYSPDDIPDNSKVYYINLAGQPVFYDHDWRIAGSEIELNSLYNRNMPDHADWEIFSVATDGLTSLFEDIWQILFQNPVGLDNNRIKRYPLVQFALKGLLLLELVLFNPENRRWFSKGTIEDLRLKTNELDSFMTNQATIEDYESLLNTTVSDEKLLTRLICIDLLFTNSSFLSSTARKLSAEQKITSVKKYDQISDSIKILLKQLLVVDRL
ncbi:MAG: hypothetical protein ACTSPV_17000 [Candidatus Hodarchaeales archaeon]